MDRKKINIINFLYWMRKPLSLLTNYFKNGENKEIPSWSFFSLYLDFCILSYIFVGGGALLRGFFLMK